MNTMTISQLARRSGVPATTLRYYEQAGVLPQPARTDSGYRRYDEGALARVAFLRRAKALGIELGDVAELVRLWDGDRCEPVQERLVANVHEQRAATRRRLDELTQLAADLDRVGASIGATDTCGPDCACMGSPAPTQDATTPDRMIDAACTLDAPDLPQRLADWRSLRDRATAINAVAGGVRLRLAADEPMDAVARLVALESECCAFYRFTIGVDGPARALTIDAGPDGESAVRALLGLD